MKSQSAETVLPLMVLKEPQRSADTLLGFLMGVNVARAGAIFSIEGGVRLFVGHGIAQDVLDWTVELWRREERSLQQGRLSRSDDRFLFPIVRAERLVALVYLAATQLDLGSLTEVAGLIGDAVLRCARQPSAPSAVESYLEQTSAKE